MRRSHRPGSQEAAAPATYQGPRQWKGGKGEGGEPRNALSCQNPHSCYIKAQGKSYFVHRRQMPGSLVPAPGMVVTFTPSISPKGDEAVQVKLVTDHKEIAWAEHEEARLKLME